MASSSNRPPRAGAGLPGFNARVRSAADLTGGDWQSKPAGWLTGTAKLRRRTEPAFSFVGKRASSPLGNTGSAAAVHATPASVTAAAPAPASSGQQYPPAGVPAPILSTDTAQLARDVVAKANADKLGDFGEQGQMGEWSDPFGAGAAAPTAPAAAAPPPKAPSAPPLVSATPSTSSSSATGPLLIAAAVVAIFFLI